MNTRHPRRISRKAVEQLLDGAAGLVPGNLPAPEGSDQLARVLAAAAAPGRQDELAGEQVAVAAFEASHLVPVASSRRGQMIKYPHAKLLTTKVVALSLAAFATGGVALAAGTGAFSSPQPSPAGGGSGAPLTSPSSGGRRRRSASPRRPRPRPRPLSLPPPPPLLLRRRVRRPCRRARPRCAGPWSPPSPRPARVRRPAPGRMASRP